MADNPNIGKVITAPNGAQFDFTEAKPAVKGSPTSGPNAFINGDTGQAMQPIPKEQANARYKANREVFKNRMSELRNYKASEAAKPLETKMREVGRSETFIKAHKNDTPKMQASFNKSYKANPGPNMTIAKPAPKATPSSVGNSTQFKKTPTAVPKFKFSPSKSATSTATMTTPATNIFGK